MIAYLLLVVTIALIAYAVVMLVRQARPVGAARPAAETAPPAPAAQLGTAPAEPASDEEPPPGAPAEPAPEHEPPPAAPPPTAPPPEPPSSSAPAHDAEPVPARPRGTVAARHEGAERVASAAPAAPAQARRAPPQMPAPEAAEVCQVYWLGRGRGSCFAAVTVDAQGVKHTLATSRRVEWRESTPPTETALSQAAVRQLSRILRDNGWQPIRGNGEDLGQERWYARRFRRTATGADASGRRPPTRTARTGDAA